MYFENEFKKYVVLVLVKYLNSESIPDIIETFFNINTSNTGIISVSELEKAVKKTDPKAELQEIYKLCSDEGHVTFSNFVAAAMFTRPVSESIIQRGFRVLCCPANNFITSESFHNTLKYIGKHISKVKTFRMISELDTQFADKISYKEFRAIILSSYRSKSH
jgi:Ca2+-binding protein (EF-Hand superfamily)